MRGRWLWRGGVATVTMTLAVGLTHALWQFTQYTPFVLSFGAAILSSLVAGRSSGLIAVAIGAVAFAMFPPPALAAGIPHVLVGFVVISVALSWLVADRREIETALRTSEKRLLQAHELARVGNWKWELAGKHLWWSEEVYRIFGVDRESFQLDYKTFLNLIHPDDRTIIESAARDAIQHEQPYDVEHRIIRPDGAVRVLNGHGRVMVDGQGTITGLIGAVQDITELKAAEETVRRSERRLKTIIDAEPACVKLVAPDGTLLDMNRAGLEMLGAKDFSELAGRSAVELVHPGDRDVFLEMHRQVCNGSRCKLEFRVISLNGRERWVDAHIVPFETVTESGEAQMVTLSVASDVTERKMLERELLQSHKMEAIGLLAGGIAHDFNNLLTAIGGYSEMVRASLDASDPRCQELSEVLKASERAAILTRQLLAFGRRQVLRPRVLDPNLLVGDVEKLLRRTIGENIELILDLNPAVMPVRADPTQLQQVLLNLAVNARDAMPKGGQLRFTTSNVAVNERAAERLRPMLPGQYVCLAVGDTGTGMTPDVQARIFEPFFTTKGQSRGSGLGLAIVYGIVKQSGGFIWVDSHIGRGTTFDVYLPAVAEAVEDATQTETKGAVTGGSETILLAEDDGGVRRLAREVLTKWGYTVLEARDGEEAFALAQQHPGSIDLLISDIVMPGIGGGALAGKLAATHPRIRVLYTSGYAGEMVLRQGIDRSVPFLAKPFLPLDLARMVRSVLD